MNRKMQELINLLTEYEPEAAADIRGSLEYPDLE